MPTLFFQLIDDGLTLKPGKIHRSNQRACGRIDHAGEGKPDGYRIPARKRKGFRPFACGRSNPMKQIIVLIGSGAARGCDNLTKAAYQRCAGSRTAYINSNGVR